MEKSKNGIENFSVQIKYKKQQDNMETNGTRWNNEHS